MTSGRVVCFGPLPSLQPSSAAPLLLSSPTPTRALHFHPDLCPWLRPGILSVVATDKGTGKKQDIKITGASTLPSEDVDRMVQDAEKYAEGEPGTRACPL